MNLVQLILEGDKYSLVEQLLCNGADPNQSDQFGTPLLSLATGVSAIDMVSLLIGRGAKVDATDADGETALHRAAAVDSQEAIRVLLEVGAAVDARNVDGKTPIMIASVMGNIGACRALGGAGADMAAIDVQGRSCLHWAALRNDDPELIELLLAGGADPGLRDYEGATPALLAKTVGHYGALMKLDRSS